MNTKLISIACLSLVLNASLLSANTVVFATKRNANVYAFDTSNPSPDASFSFTNAELSNATAITIGPDGNVFVYDDTDGQVLVFSPEGSFIEVFAETGQTGISQMTFGPNGNLYVTGGNQFSTPGIQEIDGQTGELIGQFDSNVEGNIQAFQDLAFAPNGDVYVSASYFGTSYLYRLNSNGEFIETLLISTSSILDGPFSLAFNSANELMIMNHFSNQVLRYQTETKNLTVFASGLSSGADLISANDTYFVTSVDNTKKSIVQLDSSGSKLISFGANVEPIFITATSVTPPPPYLGVDGWTPFNGSLVDTGNWLGLIDIENHPWVYSFELNAWIFINTDTLAPNNGAWVYTPKP